MLKNFSTRFTRNSKIDWSYRPEHAKRSTSKPRTPAMVSWSKTIAPSRAGALGTAYQTAHLMVSETRLIKRHG